MPLLAKSLRFIAVDESFSKYHCCGSIFLLVHDVVVHLCTENPALVQKPNFFVLVNVTAFGEHVWRFGYLVEELQAATN